MDQFKDSHLTPPKQSLCTSQAHGHHQMTPASKLLLTQEELSNCIQSLRWPSQEPIDSSVVDETFKSNHSNSLSGHCTPPHPVIPLPSLFSYYCHVHCPWTTQHQFPKYNSLYLSEIHSAVRIIHMTGSAIVPSCKINFCATRKPPSEAALKPVRLKAEPFSLSLQR